MKSLYKSKATRKHYSRIAKRSLKPQFPMTFTKNQ